MHASKRMPPWIARELKRHPELQDDEYLSRAIESAAVTPQHWKPIQKKAGATAATGSCSPLLSLAWALRTGIEEFKPARQLTRKQRKKLADRVRKNCSSLEEDLRSLDEHLDWRHRELRVAKDALLEVLLDQYGHHPADHVVRTLSTYRYPVLRPNWDEGVLASVLSLPEMLHTVADAAGRWASLDPKAARVAEIPRPTLARADRNFFLRVLTEHFRLHYSTPLRELTAALGDTFFPEDDPDVRLDPKQVQKIAP